MAKEAAGRTAGAGALASAGGDSGDAAGRTAIIGDSFGGDRSRVPQRTQAPPIEIVTATAAP
jgi:hypothetical protein